MTSKPTLEPPPAPEKPRGSWLAIILVILLCGAAYLALTFLTLGMFGPILLVVGVMFAIVAFHYVVWGWWLGKVIRQARNEDEEI